MGEDESLKSSKAKWLPCYCIGSGVNGALFVLKRFWGFYDRTNEKWDFASKTNHAVPFSHENPWHDWQVEANHESDVRNIVNFWDMLPDGQRCFFAIFGIIDYEAIIDIDDVGDLLLKIPTIFVSYNGDHLPLAGIRYWIEPRDGYGETQLVDDAHHALVFPDELRDLEWERNFFEAHGITRAKERHVFDLKEPDWKRKLREKN